MFKRADTARKTSGTVEFPRERRRQEKKLYREVAMIPAKMTARYCRIPSQTSAGTRRNERIGSSRRNIAIFKRTVTDRMRQKAWQMEDLRASLSPFPW